MKEALRQHNTTYQGMQRLCSLWELFLAPLYLRAAVTSVSNRIDVKSTKKLFLYEKKWGQINEGLQYM